MDTISKESVLSDLYTCIDLADSHKQFGTTFYDGYVAGLSRAIGEVRNMSEVPVRSVLGWEHISLNSYRCGCGYEGSYTNFCPKCGALMRMVAHWKCLRSVGEANRDVYICSKCGNHEFSPFPYCADCGSEMVEDK